MNKDATPKKLAETHPRLAGAIIILVAAALFYLAIWLPIVHTAPGDTVRVSMIGFAAIFMFFLVGAVLLVLGAFGMQLMMSVSQSGLASKVMVAVLVVLTFVAFAVFTSWLQGNGYIG